MPVVFGKRMLRGGRIVLRDGRRYRLQARTGQVQRGKQLVVSQRSGCGDRHNGQSQE